MTIRAAVYARISKDDGEALGVGRQTEDCVALAAARGWEVVGTYTDNNVSATHAKVRPAYERMLADIESGAVNAVVVWDIDRLTRKMRELETFIEFAQQRGLALASVGGEVDLSTEQGQLTARIKGSVARYEADQMGRRVRRRHEQNARAGRSYGGQTPFGYERRAVEPDGPKVLVPHAVEGPLVQEAFRRLLDGDSLWGITRDWKARGIVGKRGNYMRGNVLGNMMRRPVYAGLRTWKGEVLGGGEWEPLVSKEDHARALAILDAPGRFHMRGTAPKYLLSGIARCGREECGGLLRPKVQSGRAPSLVCWDCQKVTRKMEPIDEYVTEVVLRRLEKLDLDLAEPEDGSAFAEAVAGRDAVQARMDEVADAIARGTLPLRIAERSAAQLAEELASAEQRVQALAPQPELRDATGPGARAAWKASDLERKRALLRMLVDVTVAPSGPGVPFHTDQVSVDWRA